MPAAHGSPAVSARWSEGRAASSRQCSARLRVSQENVRECIADDAREPLGPRDQYLVDRRLSRRSGIGVYSSTKFAVEGITEALHAELKPLGIYATVVEPGYFRTDFLDASSLVVAPDVIDDYDDTSGAVRRKAVQMNHNQPGNPAKLAVAMMTLVDALDPPLRLPLGTDTLAAIAAKNAYVEQEMETWRDLSASTDFAG